MEIVYILLSIFQAMGISLGVGCSTVALTSFFVAIADGKIDEVERKMLGVAYTLLRVAMAIIFVSTAFLALVLVLQSSLYVYLQPFTVAIWILIFALYTNALLMTKHIMPSTFGPAIQASSWYVLGILMALESLSLTHFTLFQFIVAYLACIAFATALVNAVLTHLKRTHV